jgi:hypothetical protein
LNVAFTEAVEAIDEGTVEDLLRVIRAGLDEPMLEAAERSDGIEEGFIEAGDEEAGLEALGAEECELA